MRSLKDIREKYEVYLLLLGPGNIIWYILRTSFETKQKRMLCLTSSKNLLKLRKLMKIHDFQKIKLLSSRVSIIFMSLHTNILELILWKMVFQLYTVVFFGKCSNNLKLRLSSFKWHIGWFFQYTPFFSIEDMYYIVWKALTLYYIHFCFHPKNIFASFLCFFKMRCMNW